MLVSWQRTSIFMIVAFHGLSKARLSFRKVSLSEVIGKLSAQSHPTRPFDPEAVPRIVAKDAANTQVPIPASQPQNATSTDTASSPGYVQNPGQDLPDDLVNCRDLKTGRSNKCWNELHLTDWVTNWMNENPCYQDEAFASCFLRLEGFYGLDCTGIKVSSCTSPQGIIVGTAPEVFYVAYNIYGTSNNVRPLEAAVTKPSNSHQPIFSLLVYCSHQFGSASRE